MKKAGIVTICDYVNYGNRLQNYATQEVLQSLGLGVETIVNTPCRVSRMPPLSFRQRIVRVFRMTPGAVMKKIRSKISNRLNRETLKQLQSQKESSFRLFTQKHIRETPFVVAPDHIPGDLADGYDFFVVGSDQVWNPSFRNGSPFDFLQFAPPEKRVAYAPSFGITEIPAPYVADYKQWITEMTHLSVREHAGAGLIKKLTGRDAVVLVDPTLMLSREKWLQLIDDKKEPPQKPYLLTYFLGEPDKADKKRIEQIAADKQLEIVCLASIASKDRYSEDPAGFVQHVHDSDIVCTDSFHGAVFSILMEKPFVVFTRKGKSPTMSSRIDTLLSTFRFGKRKWDHLKDSGGLFTIDFSHVPEILAAERNKALNYLKNAFGVNPT